MALDVIVAGQDREEFAFPTPPASDGGDDHGKKARAARHGGSDSDDDGCVGCRKIQQDEVWRLQRQKKSVGELHLFLSVCVGGYVCACGSHDHDPSTRPSFVHPVWSSPPPIQGERATQVAYATPHGPQRELGDRLSLAGQVGIPLFVQVDARLRHQAPKC